MNGRTVKKMTKHKTEELIEAVKIIKDECNSCKNCNECRFYDEQFQCMFIECGPGCLNENEIKVGKSE